MRDAINISNYVINKCINDGHPISNLKLQKILYYIQGEFLANSNKPAFSESIQAWKHGPVVPEVYYEFNKYIASNINEKQPFNKELLFAPQEIRTINKVIDEKSKYSAWELVENTHLEDPWIKNYKNGLNNNIPIEDIKKYFKKIKRG